MTDAAPLAAMTNLALALAILALTLSTFRSGRRPRHARSWLFFGLASITLVAHSALDAMAASFQVTALSRVFEVITTAFLALGFVQLYGTDREEIRRIEDEAERDPMTGLYNLRAFKKAAAERLAKTRAHGGVSALALLDLDEFKTVNDTRGHPAGDRMLSVVATAIGANLRPYDIAARYGGDEFVVLLDRCAPADAKAILERIRSTVHGLSRASGDPISISAGIATLPQAGEDVDALIERADEALLEVKRAGKDGVRLALA